MPYAYLVRVYASLSARAAAPIGVPIYFGILVVAFVIFGPTGMRASDLVFTMRTAPLLASILWLGWIVLTFPVARLALVPPNSFYLRWLPAPRSILYFSATLCALVVELPWSILFASGENLLAGFTAAFGAVALHAAWISRPFHPVHLFVLGLWSASVFVRNPGISFGAAILAAVLSVVRAIDRAPEKHAMTPRAARIRHPSIAMAMVHVNYVLRQEPAIVGRMVVLSSLAGMSLPFIARGFDLETSRDFGGVSLALAMMALSPAISAASAAIIRSERQIAWLSDVLQTSFQIRVVAAFLASSLFGIFAGGFQGIVATIVLRSSDASIVLRIIGIPIVWTCIAAALFTNWSREADAAPRRGDRVMVAVLAVMFVGILAASKWGESALVGGFLLAASVMFVGPQRGAILRRRRGIS